MPSRNVIKRYDADTYYHVYNRGVNKRRIFLDDDDYVYFLALLKRYLSENNELDKYNRIYTNLNGQLDLLTYCLMPNHFHLLLYQHDDKKAMETLMRSVLTTYTLYFNRKHNRVGHLFQGVYKASSVLSEPYLLHISRYIHMNPDDYKNWPYSSWPYYVKGWQADWIKHDKIFELFEGDNYEQYVDDYKSTKEEHEDLKKELADR